METISLMAVILTASILGFILGRRVENSIPPHGHQEFDSIASLEKRVKLMDINIKQADETIAKLMKRITDTETEISHFKMGLDEATGIIKALSASIKKKSSSKEQPVITE